MLEAQNNIATGASSRVNTESLSPSDRRSTCSASATGVNRNMWWVCTSQRNVLCLLCQIRNHLDYIHLHILSVVTSTQLSRAFQRRSNFDLTRLLEGEVLFTPCMGALTPSRDGELPPQAH